MKLYRNGVLRGTGAGRILPAVARARMYLGESSWNPSGDQNFHGEMDDLRFYNYELPASGVQQLLCQGRAAVDCIDLIGHYTFEMHTRDVSGSGWHARVDEANQDASLFSSAAGTPQGEYALHLDGRGEPGAGLPDFRSFSWACAGEREAGRASVVCVVCCVLCVAVKRLDVRDAARWRWIAGTHLELPARVLEGAFSACFFVKFVTFTAWARIFDFGCVSHMRCYDSAGSGEGGWS
jgi:hypothetical protein